MPREKKDNLDEGFVPLYRSIKKNWIWKSSRKKSKFEAWVDLLLLASHSEQKEPVGYDLIFVEKGQVLTSQLRLGKEWKWGRDAVRDFLQMLQKDSMINVNTTEKYTMITICNYGIYNGKPTTKQQQSNNKATTQQQQSNTFNNDNNDNNIRISKDILVGKKPDFKNTDDELKKEFKALAIPDQTKDAWELIKKWIEEKKPKFIEPYVLAWNIFSTVFHTPLVSKINSIRTKKFNARISESDFNFFKILEVARKSEKLKTSDWFTFDWLIANENNYLKVLEGNYK